jgi:hypothetical protein
MKRRQKPLPCRCKNPAYRQAFERLDKALEENTPWDNSEIIRLMRETCFASVDALEKSGKIKLPK